MKRGNLLSVFRKVLADLFEKMRSDSVVLLILTMFSSLKAFVTLLFIDYISNMSSEVYNSADVSLRNIIYRIALFLASLFTINMVIRYSAMFKIKFNTKVNEFVNTKLKNKLGLIHYEYYESSTIYEKITRVNERIGSGYQVAVESIVKVLEILFYIIFYVAFLSKINVVFALLVVLSIVFSGGAAAKMSKIRHKKFVDITKLKQKQDYLDRIPKDKNMHQEYQSGRLYDALFHRYQNASAEYQDAYLKIHKYTIFAESRALLLFVATIFFSYLYISFQISNQVVEIGVLVSLILIFDTLYEKSEALSYYISNRVEEMLIINEYYEIMEYQESNSEFEPDIDMTDNDIIFDDVSYVYPQSENKALNGLSVHIKSGEKIAIVGENGSGKSTFVNILLGLLTEFEGQIKIGNRTYTKNNPLPVKMIQSLCQDFTMYQTTIRDNILLGNNKNLSDEYIFRILDLVGIGEFVRSLPGQLETNLGQLDDYGVELSKGQEQKIALSRIILNSDAPIWVFDEPTAYLDPLAEIDVYRSLYRISNNKTMLFISHRLGFAPKADRIIVFEHGRIIETGTHEQLYKKQGVYANMYDAQKDWYKDDNAGGVDIIPNERDSGLRPACLSLTAHPIVTTTS